MFFAEITFSSGSGTWTVPSGKYIDEITVEVWGAGGGGGGSGTMNGRAGGGGGGGAYARNVMSVSGGMTFQYVVGAGGAGGAAGANAGDPGGGSTFQESPWLGIGDHSVEAAGGAPGQPGSNGAGGAGGQAANSFGDVVYDGGSGAAGVNNTKSGGGGGGAGSTGAGGNASGGTAGTGASALGGDGGSGVGTANANGGPGDNVGGGGAGGYRQSANRAGGAGASGYIKVSWTEYSYPNVLTLKDDSNNSIFVVNGGGYTGVGTTSPIATLDVNGDVRIGATNASCSDERRGTLRFVAGGSGVADELLLCAKTGDDEYQWISAVSGEFYGAGPCGPASAGLSYGGSCWYYTGNDVSCDDVCSGHGLIYDEATRTKAGSGGTNNFCHGFWTYFFSYFGQSNLLTGTLGSTICGAGAGCVIIENGGSGYNSLRCQESTTSSAVLSSAIRMCACQEPP